MLTSTCDDEKKIPIAQQVVGSENVDYHHHQQGVDSLQDEEEDKAAEKRVLRKIDLIVLPMVRTSLDRRACARNHKKWVSPANQIPFLFSSTNQNRCVSSSSRNTSTNNPSPTHPSTVSSPISISPRINSAGSRAASISPNSLPKAPLFIS